MEAKQTQQNADLPPELVGAELVLRELVIRRMGASRVEAVVMYRESFDMIVNGLKATNKYASVEHVFTPKLWGTPMFVWDELTGEALIDVCRKVLDGRILTVGKVPPAIRDLMPSKAET